MIIMEYLTGPDITTGLVPLL